MAVDHLYFVYVFSTPIPNDDEPFFVGIGIHGIPIEEQVSKISNAAFQEKRKTVAHIISYPVQNTDKEFAYQIRTFAIQNFRKAGYPILNTTTGDEPVHKPIKPKREKLTREGMSEVRRKAAILGWAKNKAPIVLERERVATEAKAQAQVDRAARRLEKVRLATEAKASRQLLPHWSKGKPRSEEHKANLSLALKGRTAPNKGKPMSAEIKEKLRIANIGRVAHNKGKPMSEEQKEKISIANIGRVAHNKGKPHSAETKAKISIAKKGRVAHNKGKPHSAETKAKLSLVAHARWNKLAA